MCLEIFGECINFLLLATLEELLVSRSDVIVDIVFVGYDIMLVSVGVGLCVVAITVGVSV